MCERGRDNIQREKEGERQIDMKRQRHVYSTRQLVRYKTLR